MYLCVPMVTMRTILIMSVILAMRSVLFVLTMPHSAKSAILISALLRLFFSLLLLLVSLSVLTATTRTVLITSVMVVTLDVPLVTSTPLTAKLVLSVALSRLSSSLTTLLVWQFVQMATMRTTLTIIVKLVTRSARFALTMPLSVKSAILLQELPKRSFSLRTLLVSLLVLMVTMRMLLITNAILAMMNVLYVI